MAGIGQLGVPAINVPAPLGGLGYGPLETLSLMDACGPSLLLEPVLRAPVIATALLGAYAGDAPAADLLRALARGERIATVAHFEPDSRFDTRWVHTHARRRRARAIGSTVTSRWSRMPALADVLLVSARTAGEAGDDRRASRCSSCHARRRVSARRVSHASTGSARLTCILVGCRLPRAIGSGPEGRALPAVEAAFDIGLAALCAEAVGIMQALLDATIEYLRTRQQFGQPIGRFQALQHRVADMVIHLEQARSMSYLAALRCTCADERGRRRALSGAKVVVGEAGRFIGQQAVQLHGGMGMTDELQVSHWFKRLTAIGVMFGDSDSHLQRYAALNRNAHV